MQYTHDLLFSATALQHTYSINKATAPTTAAIPIPATLFCPAPAVTIGVLAAEEREALFEGADEDDEVGTPVAPTLTRLYVLVSGHVPLP